MSSMPLEALAQTLRESGKPGFQLFPGFADSAVGTAMLDDVTEIARTSAAGNDVSPAVVMLESQGLEGNNPEDVISKIFKLHR